MLVFTSIAISANAQIKVCTGGIVSIGSSTNAPIYGVMQVWGNSIFSTGTSPSSAALIIGNNGYSSSTSPDYTWYNNGVTGLFHPSPGNIIGFTTNGTERMRLTSSANGTIQFTGWTNVYLDWNNGDCCSTPALYPASDWYLQLGTTTKFIGDAYISHELYKTAPSLYSDISIKNNINYNTDSLLLKLKQLNTY